jgi:ATP-dependent RNA helicase RhlE
VTTKNPSSQSSRPRRPRRFSKSKTSSRVTPVSKQPDVPFAVAPHDATPIDFAALDLDDRLRSGIADRGFERTTPIQSAVFPIVFAGGDLIACAETGTGKTAAFLLPLMQRLLASPTAGSPRALVLAPTRELAVQIEDDFTGFAYHAGLTSVAVYGGVDGDIQARALRAGVDMVVATPGRLLDHMSCGIVDFSKVEVLILDEADRMLDMGFWPDVKRIVSALPAERQTLLFSATTSSDVVKLAEQVMRDPKLIQVGRAGGPARTITHVAHILPTADKAAWLGDFLRRNRQPSLVFVRTKRFADRLASVLSGRGIRCAALHADRSQAERTAAVEGFRSGKFTALVATDIAARGLDIDGIEHVVNYEVPHGADAYVHRSGRTGRAQATGTALTLVAPDELPNLRAIEQSIGIKIADLKNEDERQA